MRPILLALFCSILCLNQAWSDSWTVESGELQYHVHFVLKEVSGVTKNVKGKGVCDDQGVCQFLVAAPIKSFESGDTNRDLHMLEVTKAAQYPMVSAKITVDNRKVGEAKVEVNFAGKTKIYEKVAVKVQKKDSHIQIATGVLPIHLTEFDVERPALLGMKIEDNVEIDFSLALKN